MTIGTNKLTVNATSLISGLSNVNAPANFGVPTLTLTGTPTFNIVNTASPAVAVALTVTNLSAASSSFGIIKDGYRHFAGQGFDPTFAGPITILGGTVQSNATSTADSFGTSTVTLSPAPRCCIPTA